MEIARYVSCIKLGPDLARGGAGVNKPKLVLWWSEFDLLFARYVWHILRVLSQLQEC